MNRGFIMVATLILGIAIGWYAGQLQTRQITSSQTWSPKPSAVASDKSLAKLDSSIKSAPMLTTTAKEEIYPEHYPHREQLARVPRQLLRSQLTPPFKKDSMNLATTPLIQFGLGVDDAYKFAESANAIIHDFCVAEAQAAQLKTVDGETYIHVPPLTNESIKLREKILELSKSAFSAFPDDRYLFVFESLMCSDMLSDQAPTKKLISFVESPDAPTVFEITGHDHPGNGLEPPSYNSGDGEVERAKARYKLIFDKLSKKSRLR